MTAAIDWLVRAHDAAKRGGVSRAYSLAWDSYFRRRGWQPAYPETTGYIIPTLCDAAERLGRPDLQQRALQMADWELTVQLPSGAVQSGIIGEQPASSPAVFNTGQVLFGLVRAHVETGCEEYLAGARRAAEYMLTAQGADGRFVQGRSAMARSDCTTYYTRAAWGLCLLGSYMHERRYVAAAERNMAFAMGQQLENGWFHGNCLSDPARPLLHTIAYAMEGLLGCGLLLAREEYIEAVHRTAVALAARQREDGGLSGRFASDWAAQAPWDCLAGDAQVASVFWQLGATIGDESFQHRARRLCGFLMRTQNRTSANPGLAGGIKGSFPVDGEYGRYQVLNWATKFFVDALMLVTSGVPVSEWSDTSGSSARRALHPIRESVRGRASLGPPTDG